MPLPLIVGAIGSLLGRYGLKAAVRYGLKKKVVGKLGPLPKEGFKDRVKRGSFNALNDAGSGIAAYEVGNMLLGTTEKEVVTRLKKQKPGVYKAFINSDYSSVKEFLKSLKT